MNVAVSFTSQLCNQIFSEENVERSKSVVARLTQGHYYVPRATGGVSVSQQRSDDPSTSSPMSSDAWRASLLDGTRTCGSSCSAASSVSLPPPLYDVFLGGSCGNTVWRRQLVIPFLKKRAITYYDPQRSVWSENMIYEESIAKENSSLFLFVLDPATVNATSFLEIAYFAARKAPKLLVVFLGRSEWREKAHPEDLPDRLRTCQLLDRILHAHAVPMLHSIQDALDYIEEVIIGSKSWGEALSHPRQRLAFLQLRTRRVGRAAGEAGRAALTRLRCGAARIVAAASVLDAAAVAAWHLAAPQVPLLLVLLPLLAINILLFGLASAYSRLRHRWPRRVADSSVPTPSLPLPRLSAVTTPLLPQASSPPKISADASRRVLRAAGGKEVTPLTFAELPLRRRVQTEPLNGKRRGRRLELVEGSHDVFLACSSEEELEWVGDEAAPFLTKHSLSFSSLLACDALPGESRMMILMRGSRHEKHLLYFIPSTKTFLSGMVEIAYLLGHANWQLTVCVPKEAEQLEAAPTNQEENEDDRAARRRRNDCYAIAFCYLKDMAKRKQCHVFSVLQDALHHVHLSSSLSRRCSS